MLWVSRGGPFSPFPASLIDFGVLFPRREIIKITEKKHIPKELKHHQHHRLFNHLDKFVYKCNGIKQNTMYFFGKGGSDNFATLRNCFHNYDSNFVVDINEDIVST